MTIATIRQTFATAELLSHWVPGRSNGLVTGGAGGVDGAGVVGTAEGEATCPGKPELGVGVDGAAACESREPTPVYVPGISEKSGP